MSTSEDSGTLSEQLPDATQAVRVEGIWATGLESERGPSLLRAFEAGFAAALVGAIVWAVVQLVTGYQIGLMAIGVGFLVGYSVRRFGRGSSQAFGIMGAALALFGIVLGNLLDVCGVLVTKESVPLGTTIGLVFGHPAVTWELLKETCGGMNLLFCAIAVFEGYRFSMRSSKSKQLESPPALPPITGK